MDVVVLGAGAAGMMAAITAGRRGRRVLLLDHGERPGRKIVISGGGRCNFTNLHCGPENFLSENPHFAKSALSRYTPADITALVERHRIPYHEKTLGQLFCDRSARDVVAMLEKECAEAGVRMLLETPVTGVVPAAGGGFTVSTTRGDHAAASVIVATGGLSIPKMGATGFGYDLARQFGLRVVEPRAGLVPFTLGGTAHATWCDLSGVSAEAVVRVAAARPSRSRGHRPAEFREKVLVTHRGLSGPAILQISSYWRPGEAVELDLAPGQQVFAAMLEPRGRRDGAAALALLRGVLPSRWAERFAAVYAADRQERDLTNVAIAELDRLLHAWRVEPSGTEGFVKAEVTVGGVDTAELDAKTLAARQRSGALLCRRGGRCDRLAGRL